MCGIAGILGGPVSELGAVGPMITTLAHRGPDDQGIWIDHEAQAALSHRRLSIVDLSSAGHQPVQSANGRFLLTFNGEIYNFARIRLELEAAGLAPQGEWRSRCDTEIFLEAISSWGLEQALAKVSGMFAFALWDRHRRRLTLVRDRFGEKPLYYGWVGNTFVFASELKAIRSHPRFDNSINAEAVGLFLRRSYVPSPHSIFERIYKLLPGSMLELSLAGAMNPLGAAPEVGAASPGLRMQRYWSYKDVVERGLSAPIEDEREALDQLEQVLSASVGRQLAGDVPIGAFLSGGVDSSLIVALQQLHSSEPVRTFSIGFDEPAYDEAREARATAEALGSVHHELNVTPAQAADVIETIPSMFDEPFADASQIPTHLLSRLAAADVKVALTGDGGDELFAGYYQHFLAPRVWRRLQSLPPRVRSITTGALSLVPPALWERAAGLIANRRQGHIGVRVQRALGAARKGHGLFDIYRSLVEEWGDQDLPLLASTTVQPLVEWSALPAASDVEQILYCDAVAYLPDDILCKVDRASMAVGLETRVPFLDPEVVEIAARIPTRMKVTQGQGKFILRQLLRRYLPPEFVDRPKSGFAVPIGEWIRGPLREWTEELLDPRQMRREGWLDPNLIATCWQKHLSKKRDSSSAIWSVLMFNSWLRSAECHNHRPSEASTRVEALLGEGAPQVTVAEPCVA